MKKIVLIGAGSAMFTQGLLADMIVANEEWEVRLCDIDPEALETAHGLARRMLAARPADITLKASTDRRELLPGADVVVTTIAVGGRRAWELDEQIPRKYGIHQPVGDSVMPGGISRALRHVPVMVDIARDVAELCPDALFFNYANPMSALCLAIRQATGVPVIGLCHGVHDTLRYLARFAGVPLSTATGVAVGVNHLTWFTKFRSEGRDAWPLVREKLAHEGTLLGFSSPRGPVTAGDALAPRSDSPFSWQLFETFGAFPAVLDRHVIEFFPELCREKAYYGMTPGIDVFDVQAVINNGDDVYQSLYEQARGLRPLDTRWLEGRILGEQEQLVEILTCLWHDKPKVFSVNLPNQGQVPNLPVGGIVESPCLVNGDGFHPIAVDPLPEAIAGIMQRRMSSTQLTVNAALTGDMRLVVQALISDGSVARPDEAYRLASELIAAQAQHLPQFAACHTKDKA